MNQRLFDALRIVVAELAPRAPVVPDEVLVAFPYGLETSAAKTLERDGRLKPARIGRRRYVKRSDLLAVVEAIAAEQAAERGAPDDAAATYLRIVGAK